jgi:hypothetical protein
MSTRSILKVGISSFVFSAAIFLLPRVGYAQQTTGGQPANVPAQARQAEDAIERTVRRFGVGVEGGVGIDPELVDFGAHATFAPVFSRNLEIRPSVEFGLGEVTTLFNINIDGLYMLPGATRQTRWMAYVGAGPAFGLSHRGFSTDEDDHVDVNGVETRNRFDFGDTDFNGGINFIGGARSQSGVFFEIRATAYGVSNVRLIAGFNF